MIVDLFFADSAGHTVIDAEAAAMPRSAANDLCPPTSENVLATEEVSVID